MWSSDSTLTVSANGYTKIIGYKAALRQIYKIVVLKIISREKNNNNKNRCAEDGFANYSRITDLCKYESQMMCANKECERF